MQKTDLYTITIPPMIQALEGLSAVLDKAISAAEAKKQDWLPFTEHEAALLNDRLIFDQFSLVRQIQTACDNAKNGTSRIAGIEAPKMEDNEKTFAELKTRIANTITYLRTIKPEQLVGKEDTTVILPYWPDKKFTGFDYATRYLVPNFYFHIVTAYSIIRKNGVEIGKSDFLGSIAADL